MAVNYVKFYRGSKQAFDKITYKNPDVLYFITSSDSDRGALYLGEKLISRDIGILTDLEDILISENLQNNQILVYNADNGKWENKNVTDIVQKMTGASKYAQGGAGLVPAPGINQQNYFLRGDGNWAPIPTSGGGGDGGTSSSTQIFEVTTKIIGSKVESHADALDRITGDVILAKGDIGIVKDLIANEKYQYTAYVYDETDWVAMDGNYRADNVYFDEDFIFTKNIGTVSVPSSGNITVPAAGKNLQEFFASIFAEEENPTTPSTSAVLNSNNIGTKEVGTKIAINYSFTTTAGDYKFGPANGVIWSGHKATFNNETLNGSSGTFTTVQVTDDTNLSIVGSVKQSEGAIPLTNLGNEYADAQIQEKSWTNLTKGTLTGYRAWFCGYKNGTDALSDPTAIEGDQIRALGNSANGHWNSSMKISQMKQMYFAAPAGRGYKPSVKDAATTAPQTVLGPITVYVKGANEYVTDDAPNGIAYDVWYVANADAAAGDATVNIGRA